MALVDLGRSFRERVAPFLIWAGAVTASVLLYIDIGPGGPMTGFAEAVEYRVASETGGRLVQLSVSTGDRVEAGQVLAVLDAASVDADIRIAEAERAQVEAELLKARTLATSDAARATGDRDDALDRARLAQRDARAELAAKRAELRAVRRQLREQRSLVDQGLLAEAALGPLEIRASRLGEEVEEAGRSQALLDERAAALETRTAPDADDYAAKIAAPLAEALRVIDARLELLHDRKNHLVLRAPAAGQVSAVLARPGELLGARLPVVTVVGDNLGRVIACIPEAQADAVAVGTPAAVRRNPIGFADEILTGRAVAVSAVQELPIRCRPSPQYPAWGRRVTVALDRPTPITPGRGFDVRFGEQYADAGRPQ